MGQVYPSQRTVKRNALWFGLSVLTTQGFV